MRRFTVSPLLCAASCALLMLTSSQVRAEQTPEEVEAAFARFAGKWMLDLSPEAARERTLAVFMGGRQASDAQKLSYRSAKEGYELRTQATGKKAAPYVGILTYTEETWECASQAQESCKLVSSSPVTEIFPYKEGRWHY